MKLKSKRLLLILSILAVFALAVFIQSAALAESYGPATVGSASLTDQGDTVFIRYAEFDFGAGPVISTGYTVGNLASGSDPAANVDINVLTPITKENPLTGALDKNIVIIGNNTADIWLGNLILAEGRYITANENSVINFLYGKVKADSININQIYLSGAEAEFNSVTSCKYIDVSNASTVKINGDLIVDNISGNGISVSGGSKLTVTGNTELTQRDGWLHIYQDSVGEFGGNVSVTDIFGVINGSSATVKGNVTVSNYSSYGTIDIHKNSSFSVVGEINAKALIVAGSELSAASDVNLSFYCDIFDSKRVYFGGDVFCSGSTLFNIFRSDVTVIGDWQTSTMITFKNSKLLVCGDFNSSGSLTHLREGAELMVKGDIYAASIDAMDCKITVNGNLNYTGYLFNILHGSDIKVGGNFISGSQIYVSHYDDYTSSNFSNPPSRLEVDGELSNSSALICINGNGVVKANSINCPRTSIDVRNNSTLTVDNDYLALRSIVDLGSKVTVYGNYRSNVFDVISMDSYLSVAGDMTVSGQAGKWSNVSVGGDLNGTYASSEDYTNYGIMINGQTRVAGDVNMPGLLLNLSDNNPLALIEVEGKTNAYRIAHISGLDLHYKYFDNYGNLLELAGDKLTAVVPYSLKTLRLTSEDDSDISFYADITNTKTKNYTAVRGLGETDIYLNTYSPEIGTAVRVTIEPANSEAVYQWYRINNGIVTPIDGATAAEYTVTPNDAGSLLQCLVTVNDVDTFAVTDSVAAKAVTISLENNMSLTFSGNECVIPADKITVTGTDVQPGFKYQIAAGVTPDDTAWVNGLPTQCGKYHVIAFIDDVVSDSVIFTVTPAKVTLTWGANTCTYNGEVQTVVAKYTDIFGVERNATVTFDKAFKNPGLYIATADLTDNYTADNLIAACSINPFKATLVWSGDVATYNGEVQTVEAKYTDVYGTERNATVMLNKEFKDVGSYIATATLPDGYTADNLVKSCVINPFKVTLVWSENNYSYNGTVQTIEAKYTDAAGIKRNATVAIDREFKSVGSYTATVDLGSNYEVSNPSQSYAITSTTVIATASAASNSIFICDDVLPQISVQCAVDGVIAWDAYELKVGTNSYGWTFTPADSGYGIVTGSIEITVTDHEWSEWKSDDNGNMFKNGTRSRICNHCDEKQTEEEPFSSVFGRIALILFDAFKSLLGIAM